MYLFEDAATVHVEMIFSLVHVKTMKTLPIQEYVKYSMKKALKYSATILKTDS